MESYKGGYKLTGPRDDMGIWLQNVACHRWSEAGASQAESEGQSWALYTGEGSGEEAGEDPGTSSVGLICNEERLDFKWLIGEPLEVF